MCRSRWLWKQWTKSTVSRPKMCNFPSQSPGEALEVSWCEGPGNDLASRNHFCPALMSSSCFFSSSSKPGFCTVIGLLKTWWHHPSNSMYFPFLACSGDRRGMEESLCEMCEPESARVTVPKCSCSGLCFYSQSWRVCEGGLSWKCALTWIHSVFTWGCHAGFVWGGESRAVYLPISCSRNLAWH